MLAALRRTGSLEWPEMVQPKIRLGRRTLPSKKPRGIRLMEMKEMKEMTEMTEMRVMTKTTQISLNCLQI